MSMNKVPTLVVGIGGIGCRIAATVSDLLTKEDREFVGVVGIDTNVNDLKQLKKRGMRTIQTSDNRTVRDFITENFFSASWFPLDRFTAGKSMVNGAGQIRAVSRLAAIASEKQGKFLPIKEEIQRIRKDNGQLTVMVVGSITGGTGAGLFLQLPYYLRKVMHETSGKGDIIIRGMFLGADMTADVQPSRINRNAVQVNGYACMKELNALYLRENGTPGIAPLNVDFYESKSSEDVRLQQEELMKKFREDALLAGGDLAVAAEDAKVLSVGNPALPYDYIYLLENSSAERSIGRTELSNVEELAGRMVHTLMFTPVRENALSVEDNMVLQDMATKGMNRYSSAGICRLVYPVEIIKEYVTLATVRDMVRDEWLALDNRYKAAVAAVRDEQMSNNHAQLPSIGKSYMENFVDLVNGGNSPLGRLASEAFYRDAEGREVNRSDRFIEWIRDRVQEVVESEEVRQARSACEIRPGDMINADQANETVRRKKNALTTYERVAREAVGAHASIANALFPPAWSLMAESKRSPETQENIYNLLYNVHPITARYICYTLISQLDQLLEEEEEAFGDIDLTAYASEEKRRDYDPQKEDVQSVQEALTGVNELPMIPFITNYMKKERLGRIQRLFVQGVTKQRKTIDAYLEHSLYIQVCKLLKHRLEMLSENYRIFFESIASKIQFNEARIKHLKSNRLPLGQIGVYCNKEAMETAAAEFKNAVDSDMQLDTKTAVFEQLYMVFEREYANRGKVLTEKQKEKLARDKVVALGNIFESAVVDTVRTSVVEKGSAVIDLNVMDALEKEFELMMPEDVASAEIYKQKRVEEAMYGATPMLTVDTNAMEENTETVYMAMHPDCAIVQISSDGLSAKPSGAATLEALIPDIGPATDNLKPTVLLNNSFSPYEITCFKARYKFAIEDLVKYREGSVGHRCYMERIRNLGKSPLSTGNPDDGLTVVPPHLDRYWHEEAYLPAIHDYRRKQDTAELAHAFIYALGTDFFMRQTGDAIRDNRTGEPLLGWYYPTMDGLESPLKVKGEPVGTAYVDLYRALPYLGRFKRYLIEEKADSSLAEGMRYPSVEERAAHILDNEFIGDLIQKTTAENTAKKNAEGNMLDILLEMRGSMESGEWKNLFDGLLYVLQDYCKKLYSYDTAKSAVVPMINSSVRTVLEEMLRNSGIGIKGVEGITDQDFGEKDLMKQYLRIHDAVFAG